MNDRFLETIPRRYEVFRSEYPNLALCRVVLQEKGLYRIFSPAGTRRARVSGRFQYGAGAVSDYPAVGDHVMAELNGTDAAVIHAALPRTSVFLRKAADCGSAEQIVAVNIDTAFLRMALNNGFNTV